MAVEKITQPYEFLCRWEDGKFKAYHFKTVTTIKEGDEIYGFKESGAMTAQQAQEAGFPLDDILKVLHTDALAAVDVAIAEKQAAIAERDAAVAENQALSAEVEQLRTEKAE